MIPTSPNSSLCLSVIIVNWNTYEETKRCIESLIASPTTIRQEIIVVDNASTDGSPEKLAAAFPQLKVIRNKENVGFGRGCNIGLEHGRGELVLFLNPDTLVNRETLSKMVSFLQEHEEVGAIGCQLLLSDGTPQLSYHRFPTPLTYITDHSLLRVVRQGLKKLVRRTTSLVGRALRTFLPGKRYPREIARPKPVDWLMGACIMTRRQVLDSVGGFDPRFFMYAEDIDWCKRVKDQGWNIFYLPDIHIYHVHQVSSARRKFFTLVQLINSLILYYQKHKAPGELTVLKAIIAIDMILRLIVLWPARILLPDPQGINKERVQAIRQILRRLFSREGQKGSKIQGVQEFKRENEDRD